MIKSSFIFQLADTLSKQMGKAPLASITPVSMYPDEQGYSGAKLVRLNCTFSDGETGSFVCKYAGLPERMVMQTLTDQKRAHSPFSYIDGNETKERAWFIMQDVRTSESIPQDTNLWKRKTAAALADIHTDNLMCADQLPHLPHADEEYWNHITTQISISHLEKRCAEDNAFAARYAGMLPKLHKCAERFVHDMTALYRDGTSLTVTHGDLQTIHGDHVRCIQGKPMIIDWGFSRYAPLYIDLVDYFTLEEAILYYEELRNRGIAISKNDFKEGYRMAAAYPAFIYLYPALVQYNRGSGARLDHLLSILCKG